MSFQTQILPNLPVIYTRYSGQISASILEESMLDLPYHIQQIEHPFIFQILDTQDSNIDFNETLSFFKKLSKNRPEWLDPTKFEIVFIGTHNMVKLSTQLLKNKQFGEFSIPIFKTLDDAIAYIQTRLKAMSRK